MTTSAALQAFDIPRGWRILELTARDDYYEVWNAVRALGPVRDAGDGVWLVTGWDAVNLGLRNPALQAGRGVSEAFGGRGGPVESVVRNWLMSLDGETHRKARGLVARLFTPRAMAEQEPMIRQVARELAILAVDRCAKSPTDFVSAFALALPSEVIRRLFAIEAGEWACRIAPLFDPSQADPTNPFAAVMGLTPYFQAKIEAARSRPLGGILDLLRAPDRDGDSLAEAEVIANSVLMVTAAIDTTAGLLANTLLALLENPAELAAAAGDPALIPGAVEESLRFYPSAPSSTRRTPIDLDLEGHRIPAGSDLFFSISAANRDPAHFAHPDRFDIARGDPGLMTFGGGAHVCLGAGLARLEARVGFEELFAAGRDFRLDEPVRWRADNPSVRAPQALRLTCEKKGRPE